jgi:hypothetical protein
LEGQEDGHRRLEPRCRQRELPGEPEIAASTHRRLTPDRARLLDTLSSRLAERAEELSATVDRPLDVAELCRELGAGLRVAPARRDGPRGSLQEDGARATVVVFRHGNLGAALSRGERFTVAHELGHLVAAREVDFTPRRRAEYWRLEQLCNEFAGRVLVPRHLWRDLLGPPHDAPELAAAVNALANRAGVSAEAAARRFVPCVERPVAVGGLRIDPSVSTGRLGFRTWWVECRPWCGGRGGNRQAIYEDHVLAPVLRDLVRLPGQQSTSPTVQGTSSTWLRRRAHTTGSFAAVLEDAIEPVSSS